MNLSLPCRIVLLVAVALGAPALADIVPLKVQGEDFVDPAGKVVRLWGVNLSAVYPDHPKADAIAANLAKLQVNYVRPHHNLRPSLDWNPKMVSGSLLTYKDNHSRQFDADALDKFDYLNAALRKQGIYLAFSLNWTRRYLPGDVDIQKTNDADRDAWMAAMKELNGWPWQKAFDVYKMLPMVDERAALLNEEFARAILSHVNPYSKLAYGADPQVLTMEVMNESSFEYAVLCNNKLPSHWDKQLQDKWQAFAKAAGVEGGDLYKPADETVRNLRANFLRQLDEQYFERMKKVVRDAGCNVPMTFSNLWRGDNALEMHSRTGDFIEGHMYGDPLVARAADDWIAAVAKSALAGKPFIVGELNQAESSAAIVRQSPVRSQLPLSAVAYGSLHNWAGLTWYAWSHGDSLIGPDGWAAPETRVSNIGRMVTDGMQIDQLRTAGLIYRRGLIAPSRQPIAIHVDQPYLAGSYNDLMRGKYNPKPGWQNVHAVRKTFGASGQDQSRGDWVTTQPAKLVSDTGEIMKDVARQQLTVSAAQVEAFSGTLDGQPPAGLKHLAVAGQGFATVIAVADDGKNLDQTESLVVSRTALDANNVETGATTVSVKLKPGHWTIRLTRPRDSAALLADFTGSREQKLTAASDGAVQLPPGNWHECELRWKP